MSVRSIRISSCAALACVLALPAVVHAQTVSPTPAASGEPVTMPSSSSAPVPAAAPPEPTPDKPTEPFAFGDFTWLNGMNRQHKALLDTPYFTPEFLVDVDYTYGFNRPIDDTVVGSTMLSRNNEITVAFIGFGGDFHYNHARGRLMTQFGERAVVIPRNDGSTMRGQFDLQTALRYLSEAYGGYHWDALHGINLDVGIFMSYVGLFSYDTFENWMYLPSFTSDNTPWFFTGARLQIFPSDKLKIEPWLINGWQTYGKFNEMPGFGAQILYRPVEWLSFLSNDYVGWDTQDDPGRMRFHTDNSALARYYQDTTKTHFITKAAFSVTADFGGEQGDGVTPLGGHSYSHTNNPANCTPSIGTVAGVTTGPCQQMFASWMAYNRLWFWGDHLAWTVGGGMMHNPGRYLVLAPPGQASPFSQPLSVQGVQYVAPSAPFSTSPGTVFDAFDYETGFQYMPDEQQTWDIEINHRQASVPYFAGHGGVTSPDGYITTPVPNGWKPDLVKGDTRIILAFMLRF
jgi:hypothetical protein